MWARLPRPHAIADACGRAARRSVPIAAALGVVCAVGGTAWGAYRWVTSSSRFAITTIDVRGTQRLDVDELRAQLPVRVGDNVFVNLDEIARAAQRNPWIASAEVHRILPHTITIDVHEHAAAAVVELGDLYLADATGYPFKRAIVEAGEVEGLPIITGIGRSVYSANPDDAAAIVRNAITALDDWRSAARPAIGEAHLGAHGALTLHTFDQASAIQLGSLGPELGVRMHTFDVAWAELGDAERARARAIHLDARPDHVTVAFAKD